MGADAPPVRRASWRVDGALADAATVDAPGPRASTSDASHARLPDADLHVQLSWLRTKEGLAAAELEGASAELREQRRLLGSGFRGGGAALAEMEQRVRHLRMELRDLAEAKLAVKTHGLMR